MFAANAPLRRGAPLAATGPTARSGAAPPHFGGDAGWGGDNRDPSPMMRAAERLSAWPDGRVNVAIPSAETPGASIPAATPLHGVPAFWMRQDLSGWSLGAWLLWRDQSARTPGGVLVGTQLGGSQAGARLAYGFGDSGRLRAFGRATVALAARQQRELALGVAFAPVRRWPVDIAVEQRIAAGPEGRTAFAVMMVGGVGDIRLPHEFRLESYAQAGVVGARRRDAFADAALVVDREIGRSPAVVVQLGALAAGSVQPGAVRVDVGPRLTLRLPEVGKGSRLALDWRQRVFGGAYPESGLALTLAADF